MMKSETLIRVIRVALFLATAAAVRPVAPEHHHYKLIDMGALGGPQNYFSDFYQDPFHLLNNSGTLVSWGDTSEPDPNSLVFLSSFSDFYEPFDQVWMKAFLWEKGAMKLQGRPCFSQQRQGFVFSHRSIRRSTTVTSSST